MDTLVFFGVVAVFAFLTAGMNKACTRQNSKFKTK